MAVFTVLNGTGLNGTGIQFGTLSSIASPGIAGNPSMTGTSGFVNFVGGGKLDLTGTGLSFTPPATFAGTVHSMTYAKPTGTPIFSISGMSVPLATLAGLIMGGDEDAILATIFAGSDLISGSTQNDILKGYNGNDSLNGAAGADNLDGGLGTDLAAYFNSGAAVTVDLVAGTGLGGDAAGDVLTSIENLGGSVFDDTLSGNAGANTINGGGGNDIVAGAGGADALFGGNGNDQVDGGDGGDTLIGALGTDTLTGGNGNDALAGGADADVMDGGAGLDIADYNGSGVGVTVNLATNVNTGGYAEGDSLANIENVQGSAFDDNLTGDAVNNLLLGMAGNDVLNGGGGWDTLEGGAGDDQLNGGAEGDILRGGDGADQLSGGDAQDTASYFDSAVGVTINLDTNVNTGGTAEGDTIADDVETINGSTHDDVMTGDALTNALVGLDGADILGGAGGNDVLRGGLGADSLQGGSGNDFFSYTAVSESTASAADTIQDFQAGDVISLRLIDADNNSGNLDTAFSFIGTGAFTGTAGQLRYEIGDGTTTVSADVNGDSTADVVIHVDGEIALLASSFLL